METKMKSAILPLYESSEKYLVKSKGCYLYDSEGKKYLDLEAGVWCANLGHSNPKITKVIKKEINTSIHHGYRFSNNYSEKLSSELQRIIGFKNGASVFLSSGSEAINLAITIARKITNRKKILKISNSYLSAFGFGGISPDNKDLINVMYNDEKSIEAINFNEVAAFVLETGGASLEMVKFPDKKFIKKLVKTAKQNKCIVIADEVTTGMGRTGKWFGFQHYDIKPNIVVTGKGLGKGYPISGVTVDSKIAAAIRKNPIRYAQSHQNDPLGCAVGLEVIKTIEEENIINKSILIGNYFYDKLKFLKENNKDKIKEVRGRGLLLAVEFHKNVDGNLLNKMLFENGFVFGFKFNTIRLLPPLIITKKDIDKFIAKLTDLLKSL